MERGLRPGGCIEGNEVVPLSKRISKRMMLFCVWMIEALRLWREEKCHAKPQST
jgi:hypothetical protein